LLRLNQPKNPQHGEANRALRSLSHQQESLGIVPQTLIEFWAVATRPVANNGLNMTVDESVRQIADLKRLFELLPDTPDIFSEWERIVLQYKVSGKQVHDARLIAAMKVHGLSHLLSLNDGDFKRFTEITVVNPRNVV
jgi:predicted nucleic acid-binding protein